jgi:hypothetical protein
MDQTEIISYVSLAVAIAGIVLGIVNHKKIRSRCCSEKEMVVSLDIENTSPQAVRLEKLEDPART